MLRQKVFEDTSLDPLSFLDPSRLEGPQTSDLFGRSSDFDK